MGFGTGQHDMARGPSDDETDVGCRSDLKTGRWWDLGVTTSLTTPFGHA